MSHPSYLLNPGDMFSVDIDRVLWATGAKRGQDKPETGIQATRGNPAIVDDYYEDEEEDEDEEGEEFDEEEEEEEEEEEDEDDAETKSDLPAEEQKKLLDRKRELLDMRNLVDTILTSGPRPVARHVRELRQVKKNARVLLSRWRRLAAPEVESLKDALAAALERVKRRDERRKLLLDAADPDSDDGAAEAARILGERKKLLPKKELPHMDRLARVPNPFDPSKPYETPWRPRDWMAPFAHVPRYLEVNHTICSAVYLRHPVVRPGAAEIPSPYALETAALSNAWYLRRR
jgi:ribosomal protein S4